MVKIENKELTHLNLRTKVIFDDGNVVKEGFINSFDKYYIFMTYYDEEDSEWKILKDKGDNLKWNNFIYLSEGPPVVDPDDPAPDPVTWGGGLLSNSIKINIKKKIKYKNK